MNSLTEILREATRGTSYEGRLYLVGGVLRDRWLGLPVGEDLDLVLDGDAPALARHLAARGLSRHAPVIYERFGTAMLTVPDADGIERQVELVSARAESYDPGSRKPNVRRATLQEDVLRRDFTINTLLENLHTGEELDLTGRAYADLQAGILRTPLSPDVTFQDDPLRMLRAVRFAVRFGFRIEPITWEGIVRAAPRLTLGVAQPVVSAERIRDEFTKILCGTNPVGGLELLRGAGLLVQFLPERLTDAVPLLLANLVRRFPDSGLERRLAALMTALPPNEVRRILLRLKYTNEQIRTVTELVRLLPLPLAWMPTDSDPTTRRLIRSLGRYRADVLALAEASRADGTPSFLPALTAKIEELNRRTDVCAMDSPLDGAEIMHILGIAPGPHVRDAKQMLTEAVLDEALTEGDKAAAERRLRDWWKHRES